jgi:hypothetical protein
MDNPIVFALLRSRFFVSKSSSTTFKASKLRGFGPFSFEPSMVV